MSSSGILPVVYLIPGFATDERIFSLFDLYPFPTKAIRFPKTLHCKSLAEFARELIPQIDTTHPFVLCGVSMGGMLSLEISRLIRPESVILISSVKSRNEMPVYLKFLKDLPLYKAANELIVEVMSKTAPKVMGIAHQKHAQALQDMIASTGVEMLKKQAQWCVEWDPQPFEVRTFHIHGTLDELFPIWNVKPDLKIKGGNHQMLYFKRKEIQDAVIANLKEVSASIVI